MANWISLHRKFTDWEWYHDNNMVKLFIHLLLKANYKDGTWQGIPVKRGQRITGLNSLSEETNISIQTLRTCLSRLEKTGEINSEVTNKYRIITICNYNTYQDDNNQINKQTNNQSTINQQTTNKQLTTNNKNNKENKENNKMTADYFETFWSKYPKKNKKKDAKIKFMQLNFELFETIMYALEWQTQSINWKNGYIPDPTTYINGERWNLVKPPEQFNNNGHKPGEFNPDKPVFKV